MDTPRQLSTCKQLGILYGQAMATSQSVKYCVKGIQLAEKMNNKRAQMELHFLLGEQYRITKGFFLFMVVLHLLKGLQECQSIGRMEEVYTSCK